MGGSLNQASTPRRRVASLALRLTPMLIVGDLRSWSATLPSVHRDLHGLADRCSVGLSSETAAVGLFPVDRELGAAVGVGVLAAAELARVGGALVGALADQKPLFGGVAGAPSPGRRRAGDVEPDVPAGASVAGELAAEPVR